METPKCAAPGGAFCFIRPLPAAHAAGYHSAAPDGAFLAAICMNICNVCNPAGYLVTAPDGAFLAAICTNMRKVYDAAGYYATDPDGALLAAYWILQFDFLTVVINTNTMPFVAASAKHFN
jgi:hypothetical protein